MRDSTPVGRNETKIGKIEDLMATPERKVKIIGERAVVVVPTEDGKRGVEADWIIKEFDTETGVVTVNKRDARGQLLEGKISREIFLMMNFPRSDEMFYALGRERQKSLDNLNKDVSGKTAEKLRRIVDAIKSFAGGDVGPMRGNFMEQIKTQKKRYDEEDDFQEKARKKALKDIEKIEKDLAKLERHRLGSSGSGREADDLMIIESRRDWQEAKDRFDDANRRLGAGHADLDKLRGFVSTLDQEIERRKKVT